MTKEELLTKKYKFPILWEVSQTIAEVLEIDVMDIFEKKRSLSQVRARYFLINFSLIYTKNNLEATAKFLSPAITDHASVSCGRKKIQYNIEKYEDVRIEWIKILQNHKLKLQSNENNFNDTVINRIDKHLNSFMEISK